MITRTLIKRASFAHSAVYGVLLIAWAVPGLDTLNMLCGWGHGLGWFAMCALAVEGLRRRLIDIRLGVAIAVIGAVGPFVGSIEFLRQDRKG